MISFLKHIFPIEFNIRIRYLLRNTQKSIIAHSNQKRVFCMDLADYGNIGDLAIAQAVVEYSRDYWKDREIIQLYENNIIDNIKAVKRVIKSEDVIVLTGGGNMGVMYQSFEATRRLVIRAFPNNKIVIFPITYYYDDSQYAIKEEKKAIRLYSSHNDLTIMCRDEASYQLVRDKYRKNNVLFTPDIVFYLKKKIKMPNYKREGLLMCLRNDIEKVLDYEINYKKGLVKYTDTTFATTPIYSENKRLSIINEKLEEFGKSEVVVTDRLHGFIFACITDTKCLVLPSGNNKTYGAYLWQKNNLNAKYLCDKRNLSQELDLLLGQDYIQNEDNFKWL